MSYAADITAIIGATGSGKGVYLRSIMPKQRRLLVWDWKGEYRQFGSVVRGSPKALRAALVKAGSGPFKLIYIPDKSSKGNAKKNREYLEAQFSFVCMAAFAVRHCTLIAEELSNVTGSGYSPAGWLTVITEGRDKDLKIYGVSQRPALIDKSILDAATCIRCGRLNTQASRKFMADIMDIDVKEIAALAPLQWLEVVPGSPGIKREILDWKTGARRPLKPVS